MENRFQEALNRLHTSIYSNNVYLNYSSSSQPFEEDVKTLQELIDNYSKLEKPTYVLKANNISKKEIEDFINDISYAQPLPPFEIENIELEKYKKALNKACEMLSSISSCDCLHKRLYENGIFNESDRKAYVKEYLLKEVQDGK